MDRAVDLINEGFDCVIQVGGKENFDMLSQSIGDLNVINCASPNYLAKAGTPTSIDDLSNHLAVDYGSARNKHDYGWEYIDHGKSKLMRMPRSIRVDNAELCIACCLADLGLIQIPAFDVQDLISQGTLVEILVNAPPPPRRIMIVSPECPSQVPAINAFTGWAKKLIKQSLRS